MPTDTERLDFLIDGGYAPAEWRSATWEECRRGMCKENGMILMAPASRKSIDAAMGRSKAEHIKRQKKGND